MKTGFASLCLFVAGLMLISAGAVVSVQPTLAAPLADITETVTEPPTFTPNPPATSTQTTTPTDTPPVETVISDVTPTPVETVISEATPTPAETVISNVTPTPPSAVSTPTPATTVDLTRTPNRTVTATPVIVLDTTGARGRTGGLNPAGLALIGLGCLFIVIAVTLSVRKSSRHA